MANCVGIDLHRKRSHIAALDEDGGELFSRRIVNGADAFVALLGELDGESKIALEATYGWEWLAELLEDHGGELHLAHPLRTKAIASAANSRILSWPRSGVPDYSGRREARAGERRASCAR